MPSPAKKRKLNTGSRSDALPSKGLEYFFSKQRQNLGASSTPNDAAVVSVDAQPAGSGDEELARKLQVEWDREVAAERRNEGEMPVAPQNQDLKVTDAAAIDDGQKLETLSGSPLGTPQKRMATLSLQAVATVEDLVSASIPLDENPLVFDSAQYIPQLQQSWAAEGGNASYALLTRCFVLINGTTSRIKIVDTLVNCIRLLIEVDPESLLPAVRDALCPGSVTYLT